MPHDTVIGMLKLPMGNLRSAFDAGYESGFDPLFVDEDSDLYDLAHLIVPAADSSTAVMRQIEDDRQNSCRRNQRVTRFREECRRAMAS